MWVVHPGPHSTFVFFLFLFLMCFPSLFSCPECQAKSLTSITSMEWYSGLYMILCEFLSALFGHLKCEKSPEALNSHPNEFSSWFKLSQPAKFIMLSQEQLSWVIPSPVKSHVDKTFIFFAISGTYPSPVWSLVIENFSKSLVLLFFSPQTMPRGRREMATHPHHHQSLGCHAPE